MLRHALRLLIQRPSTLSDADIQAAYRLLGLAPQAGSDAVRTRYLQLARQHHPDVSDGDDTQMKAINTAYETVQLYGATLSSSSSAHGGLGGPSPAANPSGSRQPATAPKRRARHSARPWTAAADTWNLKSEFDWNVALHSVPEQDLAKPSTHPHSGNRLFSHDDDRTFYEMVRGGSTIAQTAATMGRSVYSIEARLNHSQFKRRIQALVKSAKFHAVSNANQGGSHSTVHHQHQQDDVTHPIGGGNLTERMRRARQPVRWPATRHVNAVTGRFETRDDGDVAGDMAASNLFSHDVASAEEAFDVAWHGGVARSGDSGHKAGAGGMRVAPDPLSRSTSPLVKSYAHFSRLPVRESRARARRTYR
jgi:hypothetical protein